jgi:hypothetical protein
MRDTPNFDDANFALRLYELRREPELRKARKMVGDLWGAGAEAVDAIRQYEHPENAHFRQATSYWEMCASFVNRGIFHPDVFLDTCGEGVFTYATLEPHVERIRATGAPRFLVQLERAIRENPPLGERLAAIKTSMASAGARGPGAKKASGKAKSPKRLAARR